MSWIEVETKIKVDSKILKDVRKRIRKIARYSKKEKKIDEYFSLEYFNYPSKSLRIRDKGKIREVNFKQRMGYVNGVHSKKEVQFKVSDLEGFYNLIHDFGFRKWLRKEKTTELYITKNGVNIELNQVVGLGWYIEIEVLCDKKDVAKARKKVIDIRDKLEFGKKDIEKKGYTKILWAKKDNN
jgi:adenylate cyclase, class 2